MTHTGINRLPRLEQTLAMDREIQYVTGGGTLLLSVTGFKAEKDLRDPLIFPHLCIPRTWRIVRILINTR